LWIDAEVFCVRPFQRNRGGVKLGHATIGKLHREPATGAHLQSFEVKL